MSKDDLGPGVLCADGMFVHTDHALEVLRSGGVVKERSYLLGTIDLRCCKLI